MSPPPEPDPLFDAYAADYDTALARGVDVSGENKDFFASARAAWSAKRLQSLGIEPRSGLDFGCGTGSATPFLLESLKLSSLLGVDISPGSIQTAQKLHGSSQVSFQGLREYHPNGTLDVAYSNGVFHHIPIAERAKAVAQIHQSLKPGGILAFWENNPWNPGTRYVMYRIPFDRDAIPLPPPESVRLLKAGGFEVLRQDFLFYFPRFLAWFRFLEPALVSLPLGAQYLVLCKKPSQ